MSVLKVSEITEAMEVFRQRCRALDATRDALTNTILKSLLQTIIEQEKALETALEDRRNPVEIAYSDHIDYTQDGRCTFDE